MSADSLNSFTTSIPETQFAGQGNGPITSPDHQDGITASKPSVISFDNLTFDPAVIHSLQKSYNDSMMPKSKKAHHLDLEAIRAVTENVIKQKSDDKNDPSAAQAVLGNIQKYLEEAEKIYDRFYAPGAPDAPQVKGYRFPTSVVRNSIMTVEHVAGLALVQTVATPGSEEELLSSGVSSRNRGLTIAQAKYDAGKSFTSLLESVHLALSDGRRHGDSLEALRKLMGRILTINNQTIIDRRNIVIKKAFNDRPRAILEKAAEDKNNAAINIATPAKENGFTNSIKRLFGQVPSATRGTSNNRNILSNDDVTQSATSNLVANFVSEPELANDPFSYNVTGNAAAAVDTNTAIALENDQVVEMAATNIISISPGAMQKNLADSLEQSVELLHKLLEKTSSAPLNVR